MGRLRLKIDREERVVPLAAATTIGRNPSSTWVIDDLRAPWTWVELRWAGDHWSWRENESRKKTVSTRGSGVVCPVLQGDWRRMDRSMDYLRIPHLMAQVIDPGPPEPFAIDVVDNVEVPLGPVLAHLGGTPTQQRDFVMDGRVLRFFPALPPEATRAADADLPEEEEPEPHGAVEPGDRVDRGDVLYWFRERGGDWVLELRTMLDHANTELFGVIEKKCLLTAIPYARARLAGQNDGYLTLDQAVAAWRDLTGRPDQDQKQLSENVGKLRMEIEASVTVPGGFFSKVTQGRRRIEVPPRQLRVDGEAERPGKAKGPAR